MSLSCHRNLASTGLFQMFKDKTFCHEQTVEDRSFVTNIKFTQFRQQLHDSWSPIALWLLLTSVHSIKSICAEEPGSASQRSPPAKPEKKQDQIVHLEKDDFSVNCLLRNAFAWAEGSQIGKLKGRCKSSTQFSWCER